MKTVTVRDLRYNFPQIEAWLSGGEEISEKNSMLSKGEKSTVSSIRI